jgi:hypothetical protein
MKKSLVTRVFIMAIAVCLVFAFAITAFALEDTFPYLGWSQFRVVKLNKAGADVRGLQQYLKMTGYYSDSVDGHFGSNTDAAVRNYQRAHGLAVDGSCGPLTWAKLRQYLWEFCANYNEVSYAPGYSVYPWDLQTYDQDRFLHRIDGSWWVEWGNDYRAWNDPLQMWTP